MALKGEEYRLLLTLRDQASARYKAVTGKIEKSSQAMAQKISANWMKMAAGAVAAYAIVDKAWDFGETFARFEQSSQAFNSMVSKMGMNAEEEFDKIREASAGLVDDKTLVEAANRAMSLGIPIERLGQLMEISRAKARDMGTTTSSAFNDIVTGIGRASPLILDNLGLIIKIGEANKEYADSIGKTVQQMTAADKKQAILNAAITSGEEAVLRHNMALLTTAERMQQISTTISNLKLLIGEIVVRVGAGIAGIGALLVLASAALTAPFAKGREVMAEAHETAKQMFDLMLAKSSEVAAAMSMGDNEGSLGGAVKAAAGSVAAMKEELKKAREALDQLNPATQEYVLQLQTVRDLETEIKDVLAEAEIKLIGMTRTGIDEFSKLEARWLAVQKKISVTTENLVVEQTEAVRGLTGEFQKELEGRAQMIHDVMFQMAFMVRGMFADVFSNTEAVARKAIKAIILMVIDLVQSLILAAAAAMAAKQILTWGFSSFTDIPLLAAATIGLQALRAFVGGKFHRGGVVGGEGMYLNAPSDREFPILVRGGETVRTEDQEAALQGGGVTIQIVRPYIATKEAFKRIVEDGMREAGVSDVSDYFRAGKVVTVEG